jgi:Holliday junction DNA helicase RuvA
VAEQQGARLLKVPGIGKKTAERLMLELKDRLIPAQAAGTSSSPTHEAGADVLRALLALGYSEREAAVAIRQLPADTQVSDGIRLALRQLARS